MRLTRRQAQILAFVRDQSMRQGTAPTLSEIAHRLRVSKVTVFEHLGALEKKGAITREAGRARSIALTPAGRSALPPLTLPVLGTIAAGRPIEAIEDPAELDLAAWVGRSQERFALRVRGDSMIGEQIREGDYVIVERRDRAETGDTVVALLEDGEVTLKKLRRQGRTILLEAANPAYPPIVASTVKIQGVVVGLLRKYDAGPGEMGPSPRGAVSRSHRRRDPDPA